MSEDRPALAWFVTILDRFENELMQLEEMLGPLTMTYDAAEEILAAFAALGTSQSQLRHGLHEAFR